MAGEVASLLLSRSAVPILYYKLWRKRKGIQKDANAPTDQTIVKIITNS
ncbi:hypothetical protein LC613_31865 [Nostoc sphaeroides CHAB 2801]|nr:hypothetical protein [Nostoc sphaeroides]MCC5632242.1 hypothetical protein [Nostoc sphaeroides CHAB 2801]